MKETPAAQEAFEDYYGMGPERSLPKLHEQYVERDQGGAELCPPTTRLNTLKEWSAKHGWQERVKERVRERAAGIRDKLEERAGQMRESVGGFLLVEISRLLEKLNADKTTVLVETVSDLEKEVKLFFQLAEQPLSDKIDANVKHSGEVETIAKLGLDPEARGLAAEFADRLAEIVAGKPGSHAD